MLVHSAPLLTVILVDMAALLLYNYAGMCVTGKDLQLHICSEHPHTKEEGVLSEPGQSDLLLLCPL